MFKGQLTNIIERACVNLQVIELKRGDILNYVLVNYPNIPIETREKIESECQDSFDYANLLVEYYQENKSLLS